MAETEERHMTFLEHLEELRWTIVWIVVATVVGAAVAWHYSDALLGMLGDDLAEVLSGVLGGGAEYRLHVFEVSEAFTTRLKIALLVGFLAALPFNTYKVWQFVSPGLFKRERRLVAPLILLSIVLFYCGVLFAYPFMVKLTVGFLFRLKPPSVVATVRLGSYVSFVTKFCLTFGMVFQLPLIMATLTWLGVVSSRTLLRGWRYAFVGILVLSAILTPPDVLSQIFMAVPMLGLYWLGYVLARAFEKKRRGLPVGT